MTAIRYGLAQCFIVRISLSWYNVITSKRIRRISLLVADPIIANSTVRQYPCHKFCVNQAVQKFSFFVINRSHIR